MTEEDIKPKYNGIPHSKISREEFNERIVKEWDEAEKKGAGRLFVREMAKNNLFFLCVYVLKQDFLNRDFVYDFCNEIDRKCFGRIWILARDHFKSTLLTIYHTIQLILKNPEDCICIYSYNQDKAAEFLNSIKVAIENSVILKTYFDDIFYENPAKESPCWNSNGLIVKRKAITRKEATVGCSGLVGRQETGMHYTIGVYDDCVTPESVKTQDMIQTVIKQWRMSLNTLVTENPRYMVIGTFYHFEELYNTLIKDGTLEPIIQPCRDEKGRPICYSEESLQKKQKALGAEVWASQYMCDPKQARADGFKREWIKRWEANNFKGLNIYAMCDPAGKVGKGKDYTAIWVFGLSSDGNLMIIDLVLDKMNLTQKTKMLFDLDRRYKPKMFFYEEIGMQSDIEHIESKMADDNYRFVIKAVRTYMDKQLRINSLQPMFEEGKIWLPYHCYHTNWENKRVDTIDEFLKNEYDNFPFITHDDALDCLSMFNNPTVRNMVVFPRGDEDTFIRDRNKSKISRADYDPLFDC